MLLEISWNLKSQLGAAGGARVFGGLWSLFQAAPTGPAGGSSHCLMEGSPVNGTI